MAALSLTYTITNGTTIDGSQVAQDYTDIVNYVNANVIRTDGVNAMTAKLSTDNTDPTVDAHAVRKAYMDGAVVVASAGVTGQSFPAATWTTVLFQTKNRDGVNGGNSSTNYVLGTGLFTAPKTGLYLIAWSPFTATMTNGSLWQSRINITGSQTVNIAGPQRIGNQTPLVDITTPFSAMWYLQANDVVAPQIQGNNNENRTGANHLMIAWLHA